MCQLNEKFPKMSKARKKLIANTLLTGFEYILEVGEDDVCKFLLEEGVDFSVFPHVKERIDKYIRETGYERD